MLAEAEGEMPRSLPASAFEAVWVRSEDGFVAIGRAVEDDDVLTRLQLATRELDVSLDTPCEILDRADETQHLLDRVRQQH